VPNVQELSAPYGNHLLPVLVADPGVCPVCHTFLVGDFDVCYQCNEARRSLPSTTDAVAFVALAVKGEQLARELAVYKGNSPDAAGRTRPRLAAVLWRWLVDHEDCVAEAADIVRFPVVTTVPSTSGRGNHPLQDMVGRAVRHTSDRYRPLLKPGADAPGDRSFTEERFEAMPAASHEPVLLIDDTFTTGSHVQSAASALVSAGWGPIGVVSIGRHFNRQPAGDQYRQAAEEYYQQARRRGWDWSRCCLCGRDWDFAS
jgi:predicted amidophosphoribosyltransferase